MHVAPQHARDSNRTERGEGIGKKRKYWGVAHTFVSDESRLGSG